MAKFRIFPLDAVRQILRYDASSGKLFWLPRDEFKIKSSAHRATWNKRFAHKEAFTYVHKSGYKVGTLLGAQMKAHRIAWALYYGEWPSEEVDHINMVKTDNKIANLRLATDSQNASNKSLYSNNTSGFKGVHFHKQSGKFRAGIRLNGKQKHLGSFDSAEEGAAAYQRSMKEYHGAFARSA